VNVQYFLPMHPLVKPMGASKEHSFQRKVEFDTRRCVLLSNCLQRSGN